jgi:Tol biopolymer transport system component
VKTVRLNHLRAALLAAAAGLLAAAGLVVVLYAQPAEANYPGTNGKIHYSGDGQDFEIYSIDPDGGSNVRVTQNQSGNWEPAYSPTGKKVAYSGWDGNDWEIYTADLDGGSRVNVTNNNVDDRHPYYSPNGTKIAYSSDAGGD